MELYKNECFSFGPSVVVARTLQFGSFTKWCFMIISKSKQFYFATLVNCKFN